MKCADPVLCYTDGKTRKFRHFSLAGYLKREDAKRHVYKKGETNESYRMRNGGKLNLPIYYRNKLFTEEEREKLFLENLDTIRDKILLTPGDTVFDTSNESMSVAPFPSLLYTFYRC